jgi:predicted Fe-Mo cluster-binding NifX family protein
MSVTRIAIPAETDEGLGSKRSGHFGHSQHFIVIELENGKVAGVTGLKNLPHGAGGCMQPVGLLAEHGVESLVVGGIGRGPFQRLHQQGIKVFFADLMHFPDIQSALDGFLGNKLPPLHPEQLCTNNGTCHH